MRPPLPVLLVCFTPLFLSSAEPSREARLAQLRKQTEDGLRGFEQTMAKPDPKPTVRDLTAAGYITLATDGDPAHAEAFFRQAFAAQEMSPASPDFGTVPWQVGHVEIKDANSIEFTTQSLAGALMRFGGKLSPAFLKEAQPHLRAALAAIRRHKVKPAYTNIFTMKTANLLLLGHVMKDDSAVRDGAAALQEWIAFTRANGIGEYDSPTYNSVDLECLGHALTAAPDEATRAKVRAALNFLSADLDVNFFPGTGALSGPMSRTYDFLYHRGSIQRDYYLEGVSASLDKEKPLDTFWINAQLSGYETPSAIRELAALPERLIHSRFGPEPGRDRTLCITPDFAMGSTSAYYGPQGVEISAEFASAKKLPATWVALDPFDAPYGKEKTLDRSGHSKPKVLRNLLASVQDRGTVLALFDQSPEAAAEEVKSLGTNIVLPVAADAFYLDGAMLKLPGGRQSFTFALKPDSTVCVREGSAMLAVRIFAADAFDGKPAPITLEYDGNEWEAARLVARHATAHIAAPLPPFLRAGVFLHMERCADAPAIADFLKRTAALRIRHDIKDGVWSADVDLPGSKLEAALDLRQKRIVTRRVNGQEISPERLAVNGRDLAAEFLDGPLDALQKSKP